MKRTNLMHTGLLFLLLILANLCYAGSKAMPKKDQQAKHKSSNSALASMPVNDGNVAAPQAKKLSSFSNALLMQKPAIKAFSTAIAQQKTYDAIIVPGVPYNDSSLSKVLMGRIKWACILYRKGIAKRIIFSGAAVYTPYYEAKIMALFAMAWGVPAEAIMTDTVAEHSTENVYYGYKMARKYGLEKIAVATDPYQSIMAKKFINDHYLQIDRLPMVFSEIEQTPFEQVKIDATQAKAPEHFVPLPQREGLWKRLRGTFGWRLRENVYQ